MILGWTIKKCCSYFTLVCEPCKHLDPTEPCLTVRLEVNFTTRFPISSNCFKKTTITIISNKMEISRQAILDKTHYGLRIYAYVLRQYYPETTVLSVKGRDCGITRNPFNGGKETLRIHIDGVMATHKDVELETFQGDAFDFAQY